MEKSKIFYHSHFPSEILERADQKLRGHAQGENCELKYITLSVEDADDDANWNHDSFTEFLADYRRFANKATYTAQAGTYYLSVVADDMYIKGAFSYAKGARITVRGNRSEIEEIFAVFEESASAARLPEPPAPKVPKIVPTIFIGHGRSLQWRELKDHLQEKHEYRVVAYETGARAGHTVRDILENMLKESSFALLVMTAEDETSDGLKRARQNVVHEAGLFQGRLGFKRALMLVEKDLDLFSNVDGIQYLEYSKGNIKETFGDVLATLKREFPSEG
jgi:predicted nucleotide-binding protein